MVLDLELFALTLATGILVCVGFLIICNGVSSNKRLALLKEYKPKRYGSAIGLAIAFVVGFLAEDTFDASETAYLDEFTARKWVPIQIENVSKQDTDLNLTPLEKIDKFAEKYIRPPSKDEIRFKILFGGEILSKGNITGYRNWPIFSTYYQQYDIFPKLIPLINQNGPHRQIYNDAYYAVEASIAKGEMIKLEKCLNKKNPEFYKLNNSCLSIDEINKVLIRIADQAFYHSKNLIFINQNYFEELTSRERRVNFSRAITYLALIFAILCAAIFIVKMAVWALIKLFTPFGPQASKSRLPNAAYLLVPVISFTVLAFLASKAYQFEQDQVHKRVFGYVSTLGLAAHNYGGGDAFERYFLGFDSSKASSQKPASLRVQ